MLKRGFAKGRQWQRAVIGGKLVEGRRVCGLWRRSCLFFVLVLGAVLFFCSTDINEISPNWNIKWLKKYDAAKWWDSFKRQNGVSSGINVTETSLTTHPLTQNISSTNVTDHHITNASQQNQVPYQSPGPYLVEYPYEYHFIINQPEKCEQQKPFLVLVVPVAPQNRAHRDVIRSTWGGDSLVLGKVVTLLFLLGRYIGEEGEQIQEQLLQESKEHQDLIQSDFLDCYKNLTIKTMVMLEWLDSHCSGASYAMKIDSDMFLNLPNLINLLSNAPKTNYMTGLVESRAAVHRDPSSKWYVPLDLYPYSVYPRYALGLGYVLSLDLPEKLVEASRHVKALYLEDVYLGLCLQHLGLSPMDPPKWGYFYVFPVLYSRCAYSQLIATTTHENADRVRNWNDFKKPGPHC